MPRPWKPLFLLGLITASTGAGGWSEERRPVPQHEQAEDAILQDLETVKELEMLQLLEMLQEMEILREMGSLLPPRFEHEEGAR